MMRVRIEDEVMNAREESDQEADEPGKAGLDVSQRRIPPFGSEPVGAVRDAAPGTAQSPDYRKHEVEQNRQTNGKTDDELCETCTTHPCVRSTRVSNVRGYSLWQVTISGPDKKPQAHPERDQDEQWGAQWMVFHEDSVKVWPEGMACANDSGIWNP